MISALAQPATPAPQAMPPRGTTPSPSPVALRRMPGVDASACGRSQEHGPWACRRGILISAGLLIASGSAWPGAAAAVEESALMGTEAPREGGRDAGGSGRADDAQTPADVEAPGFSAAPLDAIELSVEAEKQLMEEEEERNRRRKKKGRIRELEETRSELAEKELVLLQKEKELLEKSQTLMVLKEELELERKLRALLTYEKEKAEEEAALAMGLCSGANLLP